MSRINLGAAVEIIIVRAESHFDRACDEAYRAAFQRFGFDADGYSDVVIGWERSTCGFQIKFIEYIRNGREHLYTFEATTTKHTEERR